MNGPRPHGDPPRVVLAVDCSTTSSKAVVLDDAGAVLSQASSPITTSSPRAAFHEQDATQWWTATAAAIRTAVAALPDPGAVGALSVTHQRESFVCLDGGDEPLRPAILWLDGRAHAEIAELGSSDVHRISGKPPDTTPAIYKLAWLSRHEPEVLDRAVRVGDVQAYLSLRMTGRWATGVASADTLGLLDLRQRAWSDPLLELAGVRREQLPELVPTGGRIGEVGPEVARGLGLPGPLPLIAGIGDGQAAGLALGAGEPGVAYLNLGTSMVLGVRSDVYRWDPAFRTLDGMVPGTFTLETVLNAASYLASWFRREFGDDGLDDAAQIAVLESAAADVPPGAEGLVTLPYWNAAQTPYWDPLARGAIVGWHGRHTRGHVYRSLLEGVALELRLHLAALEQATGCGVDVIRAVGGGARSRLWTQIIADVTQRPLQVCADEEVSAAGAGVIARAFLRGESGDQTVPALTAAEMRPDEGLAAVYGRLADTYGRLYHALRPLFPGLAQG